MNFVDNGNLQVKGCEHLRLVRNPLISPVPNVAVYGSYTYVVVVEQGSVKLMCWDCCRRGIAGRLQDADRVDYR